MVLLVHPNIKGEKTEVFGMKFCASVLLAFGLGVTIASAQPVPNVLLDQRTFMGVAAKGDFGGRRLVACGLEQSKAVHQAVIDDVLTKFDGSIDEFVTAEDPVELMEFLADQYCNISPYSADFEDALGRANNTLILAGDSEKALRRKLYNREKFAKRKGFEGKPSLDEDNEGTLFVRPMALDGSWRRQRDYRKNNPNFFAECNDGNPSRSSDIFRRLAYDCLYDDEMHTEYLLANRVRYVYGYLSLFERELADHLETPSDRAVYFNSLAKCIAEDFVKKYARHKTPNKFVVDHLSDMESKCVEQVLQANAAFQTQINFQFLGENLKHSKGKRYSVRIWTEGQEMRISYPQRNCTASLRMTDRSERYIRFSVAKSDAPESKCIENSYITLNNYPRNAENEWTFRMKKYFSGSNRVEWGNGSVLLSSPNGKDVAFPPFR